MHARLTERLGIRFPVVQAPMAGGISTSELVSAVTNAGGLGFVGAAYLTPEQLREEIARVRALTSGPFGVNLFVFDVPPRPSDADVRRAAGVLAAYHDELDLPAPTLPGQVFPDFDAQFEEVLAARPAAFSFTFGCLAPVYVRALQAMGVFVMGTATTAAEARALEEAGVNAVIAQGSEAGAHRGTFLHDAQDALVGTMALVPLVARAVRVPVVASGGIMTGAGVRAALTLGAAAVQLGTAFMLCPEAGTPPAHRAALRSAQEDDTVITRVFSGRAARGLRNRVTREIPPDATLPFPYQNALTRPLRSRAAQRDRAEFLSLWAGQGVTLARSIPAGELVRELAVEAGLAGTS